MSRGRGGHGGRDARSQDATASAVAGALYERYSTHVRRLCARRLGDDEAADAVQDTFLRAWLALREGAEVRHPLPWLLTIADNVCFSRLRARGARVVTTELSENASARHAPLPAEDEGLAAAIRELPDRQRKALLRRELQGFSYDEIGDELGVSRASVAALIHRARRAVAESLRSARRGIPAIVPVPTFVQTLVQGGGSGIATAGATAAVAVVVSTQLAMPAQGVVAHAPASHAAHGELVLHARAASAAPQRAPTARRLERGRVGTGTAQLESVRTPRTPTDPRTEVGLDVGWAPPICLACPRAPDEPSPSPSPKETPDVDPRLDVPPGPNDDPPPTGPPETPTETPVDEPVAAADDPAESEAGEGVQPHPGSPPGHENGTPPDESGSPPGHGSGSPPGHSGSAPGQEGQGQEGQGQEGQGQEGQGQEGQGQEGHGNPKPPGKP